MADHHARRHPPKEDIVTLGARLAKLEIELIFTAIADAMPDIAKAGDPVRLRSGWINGIKCLPVTYRP